jgi:4-amino-4-deoxy-L-arabinose transferase-like glycosyltransferase
MAAWICVLVACLNAVAWSFITPPFQAPDEPDHFAYVKQVAETGSKPTTGEENLYSGEEMLALRSLHYTQIRQNPSERTISSAAQQANLERGLKDFNRASEKGSPNAGSAVSEPPLYYALEAIPYDVASGGTLLDRLQLMRLLSALMAGITALFTFLFLRETLPKSPWAWTVGTLGVALSPLFGFMSGAVNPDALLFAVSAALFYCVARAFRRGLTTRSAIAMGLVIAVGLATKLNFIGLAPGAFFALGVLAVRGARRVGRGGVRAPAIAAAIGCAPAVVLFASNAASHRPVFGIVDAGISVLGKSLLVKANYIWQLYLPRLPGTANDFAGLSTTRQLWFDGYIARFGWLDTFFPGWVYTAALGVAVAIVALCARGVYVGRGALRSRAHELVAYSLMTLGVMAFVGAISSLELSTGGSGWAQARYLLPMLPLLGAVFALAARGAGRRWGPVVGVVIVVLALGHDLFSQLQVVARYYG